MNKPRNWMIDPAAGMQTMAFVQLEHPGLTMAQLSKLTGISVHRLKVINDGLGHMKYMEQVALTGLLPSERIASLHQTWCNTFTTPTFWQRHLKGEKA